MFNVEDSIVGKRKRRRGLASATSCSWACGDSSNFPERNDAAFFASADMSAESIAGFVFLILLIPIPRTAGWIATEWLERPAGRDGWLGPAIVAAALIAALPLVANDPPAAFLSLVIGTTQASWLGLAGIFAFGALILWGRLEWA